MRPFLLYFILFSTLLILSCKGENQSTTTATPEPEPKKTKYKFSNPAQKKPKPTSPLNTGGMQWMTVDQMSEIKSPGSKKYLIDIYTEWCGWCKVMDKKTFSDPKVQEKLKDQYHLIKFDAERKDPVIFNGKTYEWQAGGRKGSNALAIELLNGRMSYPSLVYLDENLKPIKVTSGYKNPEQMIQELEIITKS